MTDDEKYPDAIFLEWEYEEDGMHFWSAYPESEHSDTSAGQRYLKDTISAINRENMAAVDKDFLNSLLALRDRLGLWCESGDEDAYLPIAILRKWMREVR